MEATPFSPRRWAGALGVSPNTVRRWLLQARADDGEVIDQSDRVKPDRSRLQAVRALYAIHRIVPGLWSEMMSTTDRAFVAQVDAANVRALLPGEIDHAVRRQSLRGDGDWDPYAHEEDECDDE